MSFYRSYHKEINMAAKYEYTCHTRGNNTTYICNTQIEPICENTNIDLRYFNYPIIIGDRVKGVQNLLSNCLLFNCDVVIPSNVSNCFGMLADCPNFGSNIYIYGLNRNYNNMLLNKNMSKRVNIFSNGLNTAYLNNIAGAKLTWESMENGLFNSTYGIYSYNNLIE